jgi:hypothetical protein
MRSARASSSRLRCGPSARREPAHRWASRSEIPSLRTRWASDLSCSVRTSIASRTA